MRFAVGTLMLSAIGILGCEQTPPATTSSVESTSSEPKQSEKPDEAAREQAANSQAYRIFTSAQSYYAHRGEWPRTAAELGSLLKEGDREMLDPWGMPYQYKVVRTRDALGQEIDKAYIWTERVVGDVAKIYGAKPPEKGR